MPKVPYHYELNGKLVTENGSILSSLTELCNVVPKLISNTLESCIPMYIFETYLSTEYNCIVARICGFIRVSVKGVKSLWGDCRFIPADLGS